ncbi:protein canopy homolog 2 isoform X2 [Hemicordylus capensis]|nr:protein canopy homolog 2 isoform X2 [Hemicordylus capensis]XP_053147000.1 protein canopy homolog 2 isoform X2 [Hemicordylus capensis]XP_053147001.1 protein canopy homolog 2 isoform X2 [Hemicordylus capensis]XP_053147002.1 protein canopy homolog 2 isoform X2 [Hemicordylus capensis]XP_053147003.1 protein canopy homolog 2 isoform X2 [Hemicordylus capensis]XP_053147004.1 protein canopy homolog 2 isoform X2 [Hemicordylus capensis]XP_053147005.1 protein canopy homolog 2 isoform X2 [Hemicordylus 
MNGWVSSMVCLSVILWLLLNGAFARKSQDLRCGACRALVDELQWEISRVDPKKTIQIGSFRINPDGSQSIVEVPYARSEAHLTELLERICENMKEYGEKVDSSSHRKNYVRVISHDGTKMDLSETKFDSDVSSSLKFACESIAEEYEDELIEFFSHEAENVKDRLCSKRTDLCDHALHLPHEEL